MHGKKFGRLKVIGRAGCQGSKATWFCECECGATKVVLGESLRNGRSRSCGCLRRGLSSRCMTTHGMSGTRPYQIWQNMIRRCSDSTLSSYWRYGGRGISVCPRWRVFENFWRDMDKGYEDSLTIDRIDNDGNYEPGNCRWATPSEQSRNKESSLLIEYQGTKLPLIEVADAAKVNYFTFREAMNRLVGRKKGSIAS